MVTESNWQNNQQQMQGYHHRHQPFSIPSTGPATWQAPYPSHVYPTTSSNNPSSMKRGRVSSEESSVSISPSTCDTTATQSVGPMASFGGQPSSQTISASPKKARSSNYQVPQSIKPSVLTAMGTLAGGNFNIKAKQGTVAASVPTRRRLSGGQIDQWVGNHVKSFDTDLDRPRSMSF